MGWILRGITASLFGILAYLALAAFAPADTPSWAVFGIPINVTAAMNLLLDQLIVQRNRER